MRPAASLLPYHLPLDPEGGVVLLHQPGKHFWQAQQFALGRAWLVTPRSIEACSEDVCRQIARMHEGVLNNLPVGTCLQAILRLQPSVAIPAWLEPRAALTDDPLVEAQRHHLREGMVYYDTERTQHRLRTFTTVLTLRMPLPDVDVTLSRLFQTFIGHPCRSSVRQRQRIAASLREFPSQFAGLSQNLEQALRGAGHGVERLDIQGLGQQIGLGLHPLDGHLTTITPDQTLNRQVVRHYLDRIDGGMLLDRSASQPLAVRTLSLLGLPAETWPGMLCAPRVPQTHPRKELALWSAWDGPLTLTTNVAILNATTVKNRLERRSWLAGKHKDTNATNATLKDELDTVLKRLYLGGGTLPAFAAHVALYGAPEALPQGLTNVALRGGNLDLGFVAEERSMGGTVFLRTLPLGFDYRWPSKRSLNRSIEMEVGNVADLLALWGGTRGTQTGGVYYVSRRGEAITYHPFDSNTNAHFAVVGNSGAGKTFWTAHLLAHLTALGMSIIVVDPLQNYRNLCVERGGHLQVISFAHPPCFNPFFGSGDAGHKSFIAAFLKHLASGAGDILAWADFSILGSAVADFMDNWDARRGEPTLSAFVQECLLTGQFQGADPETRRVAGALANRLRLFYGNGPYAAFVDGPQTFHISPGLTVIEMAELEKHPDLRGILFFAMVHHFFAFFESPAWRYLHKGVIFDEVWGLEDLPETAKEVNRIVRTSRNLYTFAGFISQLVKDYATPMGEVIRGLAGTNIFLKPQDGQLPQIQDLFQLGPEEVQLFDHIDAPVAPASYSSFYLRLAERRGGIARLVPDPYFKRLQSQQIALAQARDAAITHGAGTVQEALRAMLVGGRNGA